MKRITLLTLFLYIAALSKAHSQETAVALAPASPDAPKRYMVMVEIGYLYGKTYNTSISSSVAAPTVQLFNGYRLHRLLVIGGTFGFDFYDNVLVTPMALGIRGEILNRKVSPVYGLDVGYGSTFLSDESSQQQHGGGWMFSPSAGIRVNTGSSTAFTFGAGYRTQRVRTDTNQWGTRTEQKINYKRLSLRMGFMF
jgi:hypothetical protein